MLNLMSVKRIILSLLLWTVFSLPVLGGNAREAVERFARTSGVSPESVAVMITDLSDGTVLGSHNPGVPLVPASIMKSVTTAALLGESGKDFRYLTPVCIDGPVDMGIVRGNLVAVGSGDPTVNSVEEPLSPDIVLEIVSALKKMGINRIEGKILVDESYFAGASRPDSWMREDFSRSYGTGSHAFNFENNTSGQRSVEDPSRVFARRLESALSRAGITVGGKDLGRGKPDKIFEHMSAPADEIMRSCMMRSDNLFAECMLRTYGRLRKSDGSTKASAEQEYKMWKELGMPLEGVVIVDGSGLSRSNRVTAGFMSAVLGKMSGNPYYASFFPLAGQEGTLRKFLAGTPLDGYIAMKTGSMRGIQCYAGYKLDDDYMPTHSVVIIMNDIKGSRDKARKAAERMLLDVFDGNGAPGPEEAEGDIDGEVVNDEENDKESVKESENE